MVSRPKPPPPPPAEGARHADGAPRNLPQAHLGGIISRGPALSFVEATAVTANGRITPQDAGLWKDSQTARLRYVVSFAHSQGQKIGVQLGHAGRKASTVAPWISGHDASSDAVGGWTDDVWAPSAVAYSDTFADPRELSLEGIAEVKAAFGAAVKRALEAGVDAIMIHSAHGYLLHEFLSPETNRRTDRYGGSFENRIRLTVETCELARSLMPEGMPLFCRISATDWLEDAKGEKSWRVQDSIELAKRLTGIIDVLDVSSGGLAHQQKITTAEPEKYSAGGIAYQAVSFQGFTGGRDSPDSRSAVCEADQRRGRRQAAGQHRGRHQDRQAGSRVH